MGKALDGVRILDFTHVQSGPTCTQLLAWLGADVIKVERAGEGDVTRGQLRDIPGADSLYFTMLNGNKRSITVDAKNPKCTRTSRSAPAARPPRPASTTARRSSPVRRSATAARGCTSRSASSPRCISVRRPAAA